MISNTPASHQSIDFEPLPFICKCKAIHEYIAEREDELTIKIGETINVLAKQEDDWWVGVVGGRKGVFPSTFVEDFIEENIVETAKSAVEVVEEKRELKINLKSEGGSERARPPLHRNESGWISPRKPTEEAVPLPGGWVKGI